MCDPNEGAERFISTKDLKNNLQSAAEIRTNDHLDTSIPRTIWTTSLRSAK